MIKGFPCKVVDFSTAKPGKHGACKAVIVGVDIFTNKKYEDSAPTTATVQVPNVVKKEYAVADVSGDYFVSRIMDDRTID
jgi:translation initiation factor 5A